MSKCESCGVEGAALSDRYLSTKLGRQLCFCCRIVAYNNRYEGNDWMNLVEKVTPETNDIALAFARMAGETIARNERRIVSRQPAHNELPTPYADAD